MQNSVRKQGRLAELLARQDDLHGELSVALGERTAEAKQLHAEILLLAEEIDKLAGLRKEPPTG